MHRVDHFFVFCRRQAPEREQLLSAGLTIGAERSHPGQGTANVCFGFGDSYLELIWLDDEPGVRDPAVAALGLTERARWREDGTSPFGVAVRPVSAGAAPPLPTWDYRPAFLPPGAGLAIGRNSGDRREPLWFQLDRPFRRLPGEHPLADRPLARLAVTVPSLAPTSSLRRLRVPQLTFADGAEHLMEATFAADDGRVLDLRPGLPLVMRY